MSSYDISKPILVPRTIGVCPACKASLVITELTEYSEIDCNGRMEIYDYELECSGEPDITSRKYSTWLESHKFTFQMPYVYWIPVNMLVSRWLKTLTFVDSEDDLKKLAKWKVSVSETGKPFQST